MKRLGPFSLVPLLSLLLIASACNKDSDFYAIKSGDANQGSGIEKAPSEELPAQGFPKIEEPKQEAPQVEQPKAEEPKNEEPKVEQPKVEEPKKEEPKKEEPKVEQPKKEEPKAPTTTTTKPPSEKDICEPLKDDGEEILYGHGLVGKLYDGAPNKIQNFKELLDKGIVVDGQIFMSKLNIPTRKFEVGFPRENGTMVMNAMGQKLIENFGIEFTGSLELEEGQEAGYYEIGLISDDGSVLEVKPADSYEKIIDGDHITPSKFFCAKDLVRMEPGKPVPLRLRWFQGPRYHISLIMMWRKVLPLSQSSDALIKSQLKNPIKETRCGIAGNNFFFDPESSSHPTMEYQDLLDPSRRVIPWSIVKHKNLRLPMGYSNMECVTKK